MGTGLTVAPFQPIGITSRGGRLELHEPDGVGFTDYRRIVTGLHLNNGFHQRLIDAINAGGIVNVIAV